VNREDDTSEECKTSWPIPYTSYKILKINYNNSSQEINLKLSQTSWNALLLSLSYKKSSLYYYSIWYIRKWMLIYIQTVTVFSICYTAPLFCSSSFTSLCSSCAENTEIWFLIIIYLMFKKKKYFQFVLRYLSSEFYMRVNQQLSPDINDPVIVTKVSINKNSTNGNT
jgi:hypothetical protein